MKIRNALLALLCTFAMVACGEDPPDGQGADPTESPTDTPTESPDVGSTPTGQAACSAATLSAEVPEVPGLPAEVATMRRDIVDAAVNCDYERLAQLAMEPDGAFQYSTDEESAGPDAKPAEYWAAQEDAGAEPMAHLIGILSGEPTFQPVTEPEGPGSGSDDGYYNWPSTPDPAGWRTSITAQGDWIFFLQGAP